jgi:hypothetical protein
MNHSLRKTLLAILPLLFVGAVGYVVAFWLIDHRLALPESGIIIAVLLGVFFVSYTWALFRILRWRDSKRRETTKTAQSEMSLEGTIFGLLPEQEYQVIKSFTDFRENAFERGEVLRFKERHFLPYDGGHAIIFAERSMYLQEDLNSEILENFIEYIAKIER